MASAPVDSIVRLASRLVTTPSRAGIDSPEKVLGIAQGWLEQCGLAPRMLPDSAGKPVAVLVEIASDEPGALLCLDACIDTAPTGDPGSWSEPPFSAVLRGGRLQGRGAADSKAGVAILAHVADELANGGLPRHGACAVRRR